MRGVCCFLLLFAALAGCSRGPALGTITGTVTLDGQPVDGGLIKFTPADGNSQPEDAPVTGGKYTLKMPVGEKKVQIYWTKTSGGKVDTASQGTERVVVLIPSKYNDETTLSYTVEKGQQTKDWALASK